MSNNKSSLWSLTTAEIIKNKYDIFDAVPTINEWTELIKNFKEKYNTPNDLLKKISIQDAPALICGDTHGWLAGKVQIIEAFLEELNRNKNIHLIFLGDYTDRGPNQIQNLFLVMKTAIEYPNVV